MEDFDTEFTSHTDDVSNGNIQKGKTREMSYERMDIDDDNASSINENYEIESLASSIEDKLTWRGRMQTALHGLTFQVFILSLVVLDALIVLFELLLDVGAFGNRECYGNDIKIQSSFCHYSSMFRHRCPPSPLLINNRENLTAGTGYDYCTCAFRKGIYTCALAEGGKIDVGINPAEVLHIASLIILGIFIIEIIVKLIAFRLKYFTHKFEVFDGMVVVVAWILDLASIIREDEFLQIGTLIVILRLWRVIRIVNGGVLSAKTRSDNQLQSARSHAKDIIHALHKAQDKLSVQEENINYMAKLLEDHNIPCRKRNPKPESLPTVPEYPYDKEEGIKFR